MMTKEGSTKFLNFTTPGTEVLGRGHISDILKIHYFFTSLLYSHATVRQIKCIVMK